MTSPGFYRRLRRTLPLLVAWAVLLSWVIAQAAAGAELRDNGVVRQTVSQVNVAFSGASDLEVKVSCPKGGGGRLPEPEDA